MQSQKMNIPGLGDLGPPPRTLHSLVLTKNIHFQAVSIKDFSGESVKGWTKESP
jgi:hypothetical protein